ncbi:unnamed protein product [Nippostrongylus brasiliensis]|uniref:Uncharacterized protein n=1 Tax=Nippostrongylus brasiliensis TaxID=27835 RepID=A0A0N4Y1N5_NIPBR|nr:unnamed protein product [Nippostrongylus brasiliensis]
MWFGYFRVRRRSLGLDRVEVEQEMRESNAGGGVGANDAPYADGVSPGSGARGFGRSGRVLDPERFAPGHGQQQGGAANVALR